MGSLNTFITNAPKTEWFISFFETNDDFFKSHTLSHKQIKCFSRFLRDANLMEKKDKKKTSFCDLVSELGWATTTSLGLMLIELVANNPQIEWFIKNFEINIIQKRKDVLETLIALGNPNRVAEHIYNDLRNITKTPFGTTLHLGHVTDSGDLVRTKCTITDPRVVLFGMYKFAEKCDDFKEFTLPVMLNDSIERDGISPSRIFGLNREEMVPILLGLSAKYPSFINASFTHDLEKITLSEEKTSVDVLGLF